MHDFQLIDSLPIFKIVDKNDVSIDIIVQNTEEVQHIPIHSIFTIYRGYVKLKLTVHELENRDKLLEIWTPHETK